MYNVNIFLYFVNDHVFRKYTVEHWQKLKQETTEIEIYVQQVLYESLLQRFLLVVISVLAFLPTYSHSVSQWLVMWTQYGGMSTLRVPCYQCSSVVLQFSRWTYNTNNILLFAYFDDIFTGYKYCNNAFANSNVFLK